jgi:non-specific protein-tyrosine kinase
MASLFTSDVTASTTINDLDLHTTPTQLLAHTQVTTTPDSSVLGVTYDAPHPAQAVTVLAKMGDVFTGLVNQKLGASLSPGQQITATVFDPAHIEPGRVSPRPARNLGFAAAIGLAIGLALMFLRVRLDNRIRSERDAEQWFGAPVLGALPELGALRARMRGPVATITSAETGDGKTTLAAALALDLANAGHRVICVEADFRQPELGQQLAAAPVERGLAEVLSGQVPLDEALVDVPIRSANNGHSRVAAGRLQVLAIARTQPNAAELLTNARVQQLADELRARADYAIFDTSPLLDAGDAFPFVRVSDDVIVVAREGRTTRDTAAAVRMSLDRLETGRLGIVLVGD